MNRTSTPGTANPMLSVQKLRRRSSLWRSSRESNTRPESKASVAKQRSGARFSIGVTKSLCLASITLTRTVLNALKVAEGVAVQKPQAEQGLEQNRQWLAIARQDLQAHALRAVLADDRRRARRSALARRHSFKDHGSDPAHRIGGSHRSARRPYT